MIVYLLAHATKSRLLVLYKYRAGENKSAWEILHIHQGFKLSPLVRIIKASSRSASEISTHSSTKRLQAHTNRVSLHDHQTLHVWSIKKPRRWLTLPNADRSWCGSYKDRQLALRKRTVRLDRSFGGDEWNLHLRWEGEEQEEKEEEE